jgi:hypothetical protein
MSVDPTGTPVPAGVGGPNPQDLARRRAIVERAAAAWSAQVVDLGGRNTLLYYRDLRVGTLDLTPSATVDATGIRLLLTGRTVRLSQLVVPEELAGAAKRARTIAAKGAENYEERGLQTTFLALGTATWRSSRSEAVPAAPVLLAPLRLAPRGGAAEDFDLALADDWDLNPTLVQVLRTDFRLDLDVDAVVGDASNPAAALARLRAAAGDAVPGFELTERLVVGNFSYAKQPMAVDLAGSVEAMVAHPMVCAIAGDPEARRSLLAAQPAADAGAIDRLTPDAEHLVLDADGSQSEVIATVLAGGNLVVQGPPGTGKSQTIANLIAALAAAGRSVLFVAEKRAAIDAVTDRLERVGLGDLVLDLHGGTTSRRAMLATIGRALEGFGTVPAVDLAEEHRRLEAERSVLAAHVRVLHAVLTEYGRSVYELQALELSLSDAGTGLVPLPRAVVEGITVQQLETAASVLRDWVGLGGATLEDGGHPWVAAADHVTTPARAEAALDLVQRLASTTVPTAAALLDGAIAETGLRPPTSVADAADRVGLLEGVASTLGRYAPAVFELPLDELHRALEPAGRGAVGRLLARLTDGAYRSALRRVAEVATVDARPVEHRAAVAAAGAQFAQWQALRTDDRPPRVPRELGGTFEAVAALGSQLTDLAGVLGADPALVAAEHDLPGVAALARSLIDDRALLFRLPRLHELEGELLTRGLAPVLDEVRRRRLDPDAAGNLLRRSWARAALDAVSLDLPLLGAFDGAAHRRHVDAFRAADRAHIATGRMRVRRRVAEHAVDALNRHPEQAQLVQQQVARKRGHRPLRELVQAAPDVLVAVKPCWAMSPLVVSQVLPADRALFDVVVFDEASQVQPPEAIPAILRGRQVVVTGDSRQLPPTTFFSSISETVGDLAPERPSGSETDAEAETVDAGAVDTGAVRAGTIEGPSGALEAVAPVEPEAPLPDRVTDDMESILDTMTALLPAPQGARTLAWHYRSRDERLIAFSNAQPSLYDRTMTTFPGPAGAEVLTHVLVRWRPPQAPGRDSALDDEVARVVELVREHARRRPGETLGIITMGLEHADRVGEALRLARAEDRELDRFAASHEHEPLFVKNLERVQGDERDAIILTVGYGKGPDGRMRYRFGPLLQQGGERRLNVAVTRARARMTVVSSFAAEELDDARLRSEGGRMLKRYLAYAASGGADLGAAALRPGAPDGFEDDLLRRLTEAGLPATARLGTSGAWIDLALADPADPERFLVAVETDGAVYRSASTVRDRDRLRPEHLERLGWVHTRVWSTDWYRDPEAELRRLREVWESARRTDPTATAAQGADGRSLLPPPPPWPPGSAPSGSVSAGSGSPTSALPGSAPSGSAPPGSASPGSSPSGSWLSGSSPSGSAPSGPAASSAPSSGAPSGSPGKAQHMVDPATPPPPPPAPPRPTVPRPVIVPGRSIDAYSPYELEQLLRWIRSDTLLRTDEELLERAIEELGFQRRGSRIVAALTAAIRRTAPDPR